MGKKVRKKFTCRHCGNFVYVDGISHTHPGEHLNVRIMSQGGEIESYVCNDCGKLNIFLSTKHYGADGKETLVAKGRIVDKYIFPFNVPRKKLKYVPAKYMNEYNEAAWVKEVSIKSCALVCRRILEMILENECGCTKFNLSEKVKEYSAQAPLPELVEQSMQFVVNAGNAMAHDKKNQNDDLIRLKASDCDKLLEALEIIFDHIFIQPQKAALMGKNVEKVTPKSKKVST